MFDLKPRDVIGLPLYEVLQVLVSFCKLNVILQQASHKKSKKPTKKTQENQITNLGKHRETLKKQGKPGKATIPWGGGTPNPHAYMLATWHPFPDKFAK